MGRVRTQGLKLAALALGAMICSGAWAQNARPGGTQSPAAKAMPPQSPAAPAKANSNWTRDQILQQLDDESGSFKSMTANIERTKVTVVVNDKSVETGQIFVRKDDNKMLIELAPPDNRSILRNGDRLYIYQPKIKRVEEYDLGKHRGLVDQFMLLGFGSGGGGLKKNYTVVYQGEQTLDGKKVLLLELTPKDDKVSNQISKIHLWIDPANWLPVQQKFFETGSGDYFTIRYSNVMRNPRIPESRFKPNFPKGVTRVKPQG